MASTQFLPPAGEPADADTRHVPSPGLVQWVSLLDGLHPERDGLGALEIAEVELCCIFTAVDFESADFVVRTRDGRRFHLQAAIDADNGSDTVATSVARMEPGQLVPFPARQGDPATRWSRDTSAFNADLARLRKSIAA